MIHGITRVAVCNFDTYSRAMRGAREGDGRRKGGKKGKRWVLKGTLTGKTGKTAKAQSTAYGERSDEDQYTRRSNQPAGPVVWTAGRRRRPQPTGKSSPRLRTPVSHPIHPVSAPAAPRPPRRSLLLLRSRKLLLRPYSPLGD